MPQEQDQKTEDKLQIECVFRRWTKFRKKWRLFAQPKFPIRGVAFRFGFRVKNIGNRPFAAATVYNWRVGASSAYKSQPFQTSGPEIRSDIEISIGPLNPGESETTWIEITTLPFDGPGFVSCDLRPADESRRIRAFQKSTSGHPALLPKENHWMNTLYVEDRLVRLQLWSNWLIFLLTAIIFIQGVWGLDKVSKWLFVTVPLALLEWLVALLKTPTT